MASAGARAGLDPLRVAIVRLTSLGDLVHTLPIAHALKRHRPGGWVVWIVEEREQALLVGNPVVDEVIVSPTRRWRRALRAPAGARVVMREFRDLAARLRALRLDVAIDVQGLLKSTIFTRLTGAPVRVGFGARHAREPLSALFTTHRVTPPPAAAHVVDQNLALLAPLGVPAGEVAFPLPAFADAEATADALLGPRRAAPQERVVALLPATRQARKQWPAERYGELGRQLAKETGARVLVLVGPGEEELRARVSERLDDAAVLVPAGTLAELTALLRRVDLVVGNDTGPLHLAAALGVRTIGLFGPTAGARNGPYGPRGRSIQSPTRRMDDIAVDRVLHAALEWLRPG